MNFDNQSRPSHPHADSDSDSSCSGAGAAPPAVQDPGATEAPSRGARRLRIANMDCTSEESDIRGALDGLAGVSGLRFNLGARELTLVADDEALQRALQAIRQAGFTPEPVGSPDKPQSASTATPTGRWSPWCKPMLALALAAAAEGVAFAALDSPVADGLGMALAAVAIALAGLSVYAKGLAALRQGRLNINALMTVAVTGAFLIGQWPEAAMVMALYAIAEAIEARAVDRARDAIQSLLALAPEQAEVRQDDGRWLRVSAQTVAVDALVRIRPGERVPLDGVVTAGQSALDQSAVTGEGLPVDKAPGDNVHAGSVNQTAALEIRVTAPASDSTLARIVHAVEQAQASRAPTQRFVDRFAAAYTPAVFMLAVAVALLAPWLLEPGWTQAVYKALVLLVIACPCALVISTPVTVVSGLAAAARRGILIKGGAHLENARKVQAVAMDKTGTLTEGQPRLVAFEPVDEGLDPRFLQGLARSLAARSDHPVSIAIAQGLSSTEPEGPEVLAFQALPGRGVQGVIGHRLCALANHRWIEERGQCSAALEARLAEHERTGRTVSILADPEGVLAICAVADTVKPSTAQAIADLKSLGVTPVMLTGDNLATARTIGAQVGIDEVHAHLLPEDKLRAIGELQERLGLTAMAGDGINDAPALARSDIGFAMGGAGTHTAMEAADVVVMNDDLRSIAQTIRLSKSAGAILWQNIGLALGIKLVFLLLAIFDDASMWMAVFADMGASLLVVFNGLRLLRSGPAPRATR